MDAATISISFIVAILGIAYPILLQVITGLDEKYSSLIITNLFNEEKVRKGFVTFLYLSLVFTLLWVLKIPPLIEVPFLDSLINNSATYLLLLSTILLVVYFFLFIKKVFIYYSPTKFLPYLIEKQESADKKNDYVYFRAISDILYYSIKRQNETVAKTVSDFMYQAFKSKREEAQSDPVEYPSAYYEVVYKSIEELAVLKSVKLKFLEYRTIGGIWLLGELRESQISEATFRWLWQNLRLALRYERDDMVVQYWEKAHQYFTCNLKRVSPEYSTDREHRVLNEDAVNKRERERKKFLELKFTLGGLLLYKKRYNCIKRIFRYTTSIPPKYELLPESMDEIFNLFIQFRDPYEERYTFISNMYPFPDIDGLHSDGLIKRWVCQYIAVLLLRQYTIVPYLVYMEPLKLPSMPNSQGEKKQWIDNLDYFNSLVEEVYHDQELKAVLGLDFLDDQWCKDNNKLNPVEIVLETKSKVSESFERAEVEQEISDEKSQQFFDSSKKLLVDTFEECKELCNQKSVDDSYDKWYVFGGRTIMDKSAFAENQGVHHMNFDSILASMLSRRIMSGFSETFFMAKSSAYILKPEELFEGLKKLKPNSDDHVIVSFGLNLEYFKDMYGINELNQNSFNGIKIVSPSQFNNRIVGESLFVLNKSDLPYLLHLEPELDEINKYSLEVLNKPYQIYGSIIDLNKFQELKDELEGVNSNQDLSKSIFLYLAFKTEIRWKKNIKSIMLRAYSQFDDRGIPNKLSEIKKI